MLYKSVNFGSIAALPNVSLSSQAAVRTGVQDSGGDPGTRSPKPKTRNPEPKNRNRNPKTEARNLLLPAGGDAPAYSIRFIIALKCSLYRFTSHNVLIKTISRRFCGGVDFHGVLQGATHPRTLATLMNLRLVVDQITIADRDDD